MKNKSFFSGFVWVKWVWALILSPLIAFYLILGLASLGLFGGLPSFDELEDPRFNLASIIYSSDGEVLGKYYVENRTNVNFKDFPPHLVKSLISTED